MANLAAAAPRFSIAARRGGTGVVMTISWEHKADIGMVEFELRGGWLTLGVDAVRVGGGPPSGLRSSCPVRIH